MSREAYTKEQLAQNKKFVATQKRVLAKLKKERSQILSAAIRRYKAAYDIAVKQKNTHLMITAANIIERAEKDLYGITG